MVTSALDSGIRRRPPDLVKPSILLANVSMSSSFTPHLHAFVCMCFEVAIVVVASDSL